MEYKEIKEMIKDMEDSKLSSLDIEFPDGFKISMEKKLEVNSNNSNLERHIKVPEHNENREITAKNEEDLKIITAPMVGTFYASSSPDKLAYVKQGDKIHKGQVVCILEAMKLMNEIESEFDGEIAEICVKDGEAVGYGMPLFKVK